MSTPFNQGDWVRTREGLPPKMGKVAAVTWGRTFDGVAAYEAPGGSLQLEEYEDIFDPSMFEQVPEGEVAGEARRVAEYERSQREQVAIVRAESAEPPPTGIVRRFLNPEEREKKSQEQFASRFQQDAANLRARRFAATTLQKNLETIPAEDPEVRRKREVREADVVEAARRSQAEIRRHVDSYLKENLEKIVKEAFAVVLAQTTERVEAGIAAMVEAGHVYRDRMRTDLLNEVREEAAALLKPFLDAMAGHDTEPPNPPQD